MNKFLLIFNTVFNDAPFPWQLNFQDSAAPGFTGLVTLHNTIGFYLIVISIAVFWVMFSIIYYYNINKNPIPHKYLTHGTVLELIWTITPALILIAIAFPSFRLLDVDNKLIIPVDCHIRLIITGSDVLHSFAVPSLGLKLDAVPGRLNQVSFLCERPGTFYGQCSEICGVWHGFMPIVVEAVSSPDFLVWIDSASN